ncbi:MAG: ASKHA domain-containing protein [Lentihominibacter sp.]|nr:ASKHA domain-containing protein [Lentihominibacter sp.]
MFRCTGDCSSCGRCGGTGNDGEAGRRKAGLLTRFEEFAIDAGSGAGAVFDIGTTTLAGMIYDLGTGECLAAGGAPNPQRIHGGDVISRISFCCRGEDEERLLREELLDGINGMLESLCREAGVDAGEVTAAALCGNTTMSHIFAGYPVASLAHAPFSPAYEGTCRMKGADSGIDMNPDGKVILIPGIGGHVGGDITAGAAVAGIDKIEGLTLYIDIGTNGELILADKGRLRACSAAAGPAFEGASISCGMRAEAGAIEKVAIRDGDVVFSTVGGSPAAGICGSGLIDAAAAMLDAGVLEKSGRLVPAEEIEPAELAERMVSGESGRHFIVLAREGRADIALTQKDIREFQYTKGAIQAAYRLLLKSAGRTAEELDRVIVAGSFGSYIDGESAVRTGLLPDVNPDKIITAGNAASAGTAMALLSETQLERMENLAERTEHLEPADDPEFQALYIECLGF